MIQRTIKKAVITGPTGAIGTALCRRLLDEGCTVYAVSHRGSGRISSLPKHERLHLVLCDANDMGALPDMIQERCDVFYHLAWAKTTGAGRNDMPAQIDNIRFTIDAVQAASALGCRVFIGAGSQMEYGRVAEPLKPDTPVFPETGYGMAKLCAGQMSRVEAHKLGMEHVWPRILSVYGPHDGAGSMISSVIRQLLAGERPALTAGEQIWDYLYSGDAARALYLLARYGRDGAVYPLGSGKAVPLRSYIERIRDVIDPSLPLGFGEVPYGGQQIMFLQSDGSALRDDVGFVPDTDFPEGIQKTITWMKEQDNERE